MRARTLTLTLSLTLTLTQTEVASSYNNIANLMRKVVGGGSDTRLPNGAASSPQVLAG